VRFHVRGIDHLRICGSSVPGELPEQVFPDAAPSPAHKAVIDRCRRTILRRAIAPTTAALQYMHDAADDSAIVRPLDAPDIRRQVRFDPLPLLIAQPKQVIAHDPNPLPKTNQDRIVRAEKLMSSDPSHHRKPSGGQIQRRARHVRADLIRAERCIAAFGIQVSPFTHRSGSLSRRP
jgi:hypothetical protein